MKKIRKGTKLFKKSHKKERTIPMELKSSEAFGQNNPLVNAQVLNDLMGMILDGKPKEFMLSFVIDKYKCGGTQAELQIVKAHKEIHKQEVMQLDDVITSHVDRYEEVYSHLVELKAERIAMDALKSKEKLIQLHKNGTHMRVIDGRASSVSIIGSRTYYDLKRLDKVKQDRLDQLLIKIDKKKVKEGDESDNT